MSEIRDMLVEAASRIFEDHAEAARKQPWPDALWSELQQAGFDRALIPEDAGGAGLSWADACALLSTAGFHAAPVPLAEAMIANQALQRAGLKSDGYVALGVSIDPAAVRIHKARSGWTLSGTMPRVPWGRSCNQVAVVCAAADGVKFALVDIKANGVTIDEGFNLAKEPRDTLTFAGVAAANVLSLPGEHSDLLALAAIARSAQIAGAIWRVLELSVDYANLRVQFGRPIGKFQVIQQNLAVLATEAVAARAAADAGSEAIDAWVAGAEAIGTTVAAASAKIRAGEAAGRSAAIAHQVFGAMGFTEEHVLHHFTKRLWSWRDEYGNETFWSRRLGERVVVAGARAFWPLVTDSAAPESGGAHATT